MGKTQVMSRDFEMMAWGLLFIWWGLRWWAFASLPNGTGVLGTGVILLGLNAARLLYGIPSKRRTTSLGLLALILGGVLLTLEIMHIHFEIQLFEAMLITLGIHLLFRELVRGGKQFSEA